MVTLYVESFSFKLLLFTAKGFFLSSDLDLMKQL